MDFDEEQYSDRNMSYLNAAYNIMPQSCLVGDKQPSLPINFFKPVAKEQVNNKSWKKDDPASWKAAGWIDYQHAQDYDDVQEDCAHQDYAQNKTECLGGWFDAGNADTWKQAGWIDYSNYGDSASAAVELAWFEKDDPTTWKAGGWVEYDVDDDQEDLESQCDDEEDQEGDSPEFGLFDGEEEEEPLGWTDSDDVYEWIKRGWWVYHEQRVELGWSDDEEEEEPLGWTDSDDVYEWIKRGWWVYHEQRVELGLSDEESIDIAEEAFSQDQVSNYSYELVDDIDADFRDDIGDDFDVFDVINYMDDAADDATSMVFV